MRPAQVLNHTSRAARDVFLCVWLTSHRSDDGDAPHGLALASGVTSQWSGAVSMQVTVWDPHWTLHSILDPVSLTWCKSDPVCVFEAGPMASPGLCVADRLLRRSPSAR